MTIPEAKFEVRIQLYCYIICAVIMFLVPRLFTILLFALVSFGFLTSQWKLQKLEELEWDRRRHLNSFFDRERLINELPKKYHLWY